MYTKQDLIENKKMKRNEMFQQIFLFIVFMITVILVGLVENMTF